MVFTDSMPMLAVVFKMLNGMFPQYIDWWGVTLELKKGELWERAYIFLLALKRSL